MRQLCRKRFDGHAHSSQPSSDHHRDGRSARVDSGGRRWKNPFGGPATGKRSLPLQPPGTSQPFASGKSRPRRAEKSDLIALSPTKQPGINREMAGPPDAIAVFRTGGPCSAGSKRGAARDRSAGHRGSRSSGPASLETAPVGRPLRPKLRPVPASRSAGVPTLGSGDPRRRLVLAIAWRTGICGTKTSRNYTTSLAATRQAGRSTCRRSRRRTRMIFDPRAFPSSTI